MENELITDFKNLAQTLISVADRETVLNEARKMQSEGADKATIIRELSTKIDNYAEEPFVTEEALTFILLQILKIPDKSLADELK